jgi:hypothetical protein
VGLKLQDKQKKSHVAFKHSFVALNLVIYCTFSADLLKFQMFLDFFPKEVGLPQTLSS